MQILNVQKLTSIFESSLSLEFSDNSTSEYHWVYLRDNCPCTHCYHVDTLQRTVDTFNELPWCIDLDTSSVGKADETVFEVVSGDLHITWGDGHRSQFTEKWLIEHSYNPSCPQKSAPIVLPPKIHWDSSLFQELRYSGKLFNTSYRELEGNLREVMCEVYQYGFSFIKDVPVTLDATERVSRLISIIRPTHYDEGVWDFTSDLSKMDTAYTNLAIGMHTDGNYWHETPGLQLFHLLEHSGGEGGKTRIVDIASVLDKLRTLAAESESWNLTLKVLTEHNIAFHQSGEKANIFYQEGFPTLVLDKQGQLEQCRWNPSDRSTQIPNSIQKHSRYSVAQVYEALYRFNHLINDPSNAVCFSLTPGTILIFDNWRVLHARTSFTGKRRLCGSYLTRDDFLARLRSLIFTRDEIANGIYS